jgi:hypothetical protein
MAQILEKDEDLSFITERKAAIQKGFSSLFTEEGFKSEDVKEPDDRANALAVLTGLANKEQYPSVLKVLTSTKNASPYMEYYVLEALCKMGEFEAAKERIEDRYKDMVNEDYSTLWEFWDSWRGTKNHAWSGGPLVIMSKHFAGITPSSAGYESVKIDPQYALYNTVSCTVPSVKGLITVSYEKTDTGYAVDLTLPQGIVTSLSVPEGAVVKINSELFYTAKMNHRFRKLKQRKNLPDLEKKKMNLCFRKLFLYFVFANEAVVVCVSTFSNALSEMRFGKYGLMSANHRSTLLSSRYGLPLCWH